MIKLNKEQQQAHDTVLQFLKTKDQYTCCLSGSAGTGKTSLVQVLLRNMDSIDGVVVTAPTHKAKKIIADKTQMPAITIQKLLGLRPDFDVEDFNIDNLVFGFKGVAAIKDKKFIIIDESSMINWGLFKTLKKQAIQNKVKILFMGDYCQLPPVKGGISPVFNNCDVHLSLHQVMRQSNGNPLLEILVTLRNDLENGTNNYQEFLRVAKNVKNSQDEGYKVLHNSRQFLTNLHERFNQDKHTKIITYENKSVEFCNSMVREGLFGVTSDKLRVGEMLMGYSSIYYGEELVIENSEDYIVESIKDYSGGVLNTWEVTFDKMEKPVHIIKPESYPQFVELLVIKLNKAIKERGKAWVSYYDFKSRYLCLDDLSYNGRLVCTKDLDYGYGITTYKSQGSTYENVLVNYRNLIKCRNPQLVKHHLYVALSRPKKEAIILV